MGLAFGHCVCVCVCVRAIFSTLPPRSPSVLPQVCHSLASICRRPLVPTPVYPLPLSWSPFCQDEKILILMALRLFSFFFFFATQQWCDGLSCMPHGCSLLIGALSRHIYTRTCTRFCTHTHTHSPAIEGLVPFGFSSSPHPYLHHGSLLSTRLLAGNAVVVPPSSPHTALCFLLAILLSPKLVCRSSWD